MDPVRFAVLLAGAFFLAFGLAAYRHFYAVLGAAAGLALWVALSDTLIMLPGLREHPGTAGLLLLALMLLAGVFLASRFRRVLVFISGVSTGVILSQAVSSFMADGLVSGTPFPMGGPGAMDLLAGFVCGLLFLFFERFFAVVLTSVVGSILCTWAMGVSWAFPAFLLIGLAAQPLIFARFRPAGSSPGVRERTGSTWLKVLLLLLLLPSQAWADWSVDRVNRTVSRAVIGAGYRDGVEEGQHYAVIDGRGVMVTAITINEVFSSTSYSTVIPPERLSRVLPGMRVMVLEEYEFEQALERGGESRLQEFLHKYPRSGHRKEILAALDETRYRRAEMSGTLEAYREFQRMYPTSRFGARARKREEELAFTQALETGTEEAFRGFINRYGGSALVSGMREVHAFLKARETGRVYAYQDFVAAYPRGRLAGALIPRIEEFELWAEQLEFGDDPVEAIRHFGELGDETAIPLLVGKLNVPELEEEARTAIRMIGEPALGTLMEVLISPLQSTGLKDKVAVMIGEMGDISCIPALRTYAMEEDTPAGRRALLMLEDKFAR